ncbi:Hypothetical predicted protein [Pelobates cultripes]|uniref:Uncharacterized protein n=1 Tax=Pelobates cultripes TaxID=61616 RepID=A0AAD1R5K0_PELCU|nr:Hypothetical predicted protein [Pelobates cultripes]
METAPASGSQGKSSHSLLTTKAARSPTCQSDQAEEERAGGRRSCSPSCSSCSRRSDMTGGAAIQPLIFKDIERATESPEEAEMEGAPNILMFSPQQQRNKNIATTKMADTHEPVIATTKMATLNSEGVEAST